MPPKKPATKPAAKTGVKKPGAKPAAKPGTKPPAKKPAAGTKKPATKKPAEKKAPSKKPATKAGAKKPAKPGSRLSKKAETPSETPAEPSSPAEPVVPSKPDAGMNAIADLLASANMDEPPPPEPTPQGSAPTGDIAALLAMAEGGAPPTDQPGAAPAPTAAAPKPGSLNAIEALLLQAEQGEEETPAPGQEADPRFKKPGAAPGNLDPILASLKPHHYDASLDEKIAEFQKTHEEDRARIVELELVKEQFEQMKELKETWIKTQEDLQQQLHDAKREVREMRQNTSSELVQAAQLTELAQLDRDLAQERVQDLELMVHDLQDQIDELKLTVEIQKIEIGEDNIDEEAIRATSVMEEVDNHKKRLNKVILKLQKKKSEIEAERDEFKQAYIDKATSCTKLETDLKKVTATLQQKEEALLKATQQAEFAVGTEVLVEKVTQNNVVLKEQVAKLEGEIKELNTLIDMNDAFEEERATAEEQMQKLLERREDKIDVLKERLAEMTDKNQELARRVDTLKGLVAKGGSLSGDDDAAAAMEAQLAAGVERERAREFEGRLHDLQYQQASEEIRLIKLYMPETFFKGDYNSICFGLLMARLAGKASLMSEFVKSSFKLDQDLEGLLSDESKLTIEQVSFAKALTDALNNLRTYAEFLSFVLPIADEETNKLLNSKVSLLKIQEQAVDDITAHISNGTLDPSVKLAALTKAVNELYKVAEPLQEKYENPSSDLLQSLLPGIFTASEVCEVELQRLGEYFASEDDEDLQSLASRLRTQDIDRARNGRVLCRKLLRSLSQTKDVEIVLDAATRKKLLRAAYLYSRVAVGLRQSAEAVKTHTRSTATVQSVSYNRAMQLCLSNRIDLTTNGDGLEKAIKDGADESMKPLHATEQLLNLHMLLAEFTEELETGKFDVDIENKTQEEGSVNPFELRAQAVRDKLAAALSIEETLNEKREEIIELRTLLKKRDKDIEEYMSMEKMARRQAEAAKSESNERVREVQVQLKKKTEELAAAKATLAQKVKEVEERYRDGVDADGKPLSDFMIFQSSEVQACKLQISILQRSLAFVRNELTRLRARKNLDKLHSLPPLQVHTQARIKSQKESNFVRDTTNLLHDVQKLTASPMIADVSHTSKEGDPMKLGGVSILHNRTAKTHRMRKRQERLRVQLKKQMLEDYELAKINTKLTFFMNPPFVNMHNEVLDTPKVASLSLPASHVLPDNKVPITLNFEQWQKLHHMFQH
eukprot:m.133118 g.133118  ORF g.133118 m.133118 type:complete len:1231 (-) comp23799_c0_seq3:41-3733(-)